MAQINTRAVKSTATVKSPIQGRMGSIGLGGYQELSQAARLRAGDFCPKCGVERLDYDGLLNLSCPQCGPVDGAWGGCS